MSVTFGFNIDVQNGQGQSEPITLANVKDKANIDFNESNDEINKLIKACREAYENAFSVSLTNHTVSVSWINFYDSIPLPYAPLDGSVTVTDLEGEVIPSTSYKVYTVGGESTFVGDFPNGVKLSYNTKAKSSDYINEQLIDMVILCLMDGFTVQKALKYVCSGKAIKY